MSLLASNFGTMPGLDSTLAGPLFELLVRTTECCRAVKRPPYALHALS